jgi:hypothetical protein
MKSIPQKVIKQVKDFAYTEAEKYDIPKKFHLDLMVDKALWLTKKFKANRDIVLLGILLMDYQLGLAIKKGRRHDHVEMSAQKAREILEQFAELDDSSKENIMQCIYQHHGAEKFYSLESEICCNANSYNLLTIKGFLEAIYSNPLNISLDDNINLLDKIADEKWNALSLDACKQELKPQYKLIKQIIKAYET